MILLIKRNFIIIFLVIILLALIFQFIRSEKILDFIKNINKLNNLDEVKRIDIPEKIKKERFLILYDKEEANSIPIKDNIKKMLEYHKKDFLVLDVKEYEDDTNFDCIIVTHERMDKIKSIDIIFDYVKNGGSLVFLERPIAEDVFYKNANKLGIKKYRGITDAIGFKLLTNFIFGAKGFVVNNELVSNSTLLVNLYSDCEVHMKSINDEPLLWSRNYGKGKIVVFNGTMTNEKVNRGLLTAIISLSKENYIYPIINTKQVHIDDFPSPISRAIDKNIYRDYQRNLQSFYREVWWGDMLKASKLYDVLYTGLIIESYNDKVKEPFIEDDQDVKELLLTFGRELLKSNGEIGIHGYNHQSLAPAGYIKQDLGYNSWESKEDMIKSLKEVKRFAKSVFKDYEFRAYVPPSNILSDLGREAIKEGFEEINIISALYIDNFEKDVYSQEFEVAYDGIIEMPRFTSGYEIDWEIKWTVYNGINSLGVFSHFVHPDDIIDAERNFGKNWGELFKDYSSLLKEVYTKYRWLKADTISSGASSLIKFLDVNPYIVYKNDETEIYCDNFRSDISFILKTEDSIQSKKGCEITKIDNNHYFIKLKKPFATINFKSE